MTLPPPLQKLAGSIKWRLVAAALVAVGILHILATLATPSLTGASAFARLKPALKDANKMVVLPPLAPDKQALPFLSADVRYAICRYDTSRGPVAVKASLPDAGWSLSLYTPEGDNFYVATGATGQTTDLSIVLVTSDERFMGLTPEARGLPASRQASVTTSTRQGLVVLRAPDKGRAYRAQIEAQMKTASCAAQTL